jgi:hypothetical protein
MLFLAVLSRIFITSVHAPSIRTESNNGLYLSSGSQPILSMKEKWPQPQVAIDTGEGCHQAAAHLFPGDIQN